MRFRSSVVALPAVLVLHGPAHADPPDASGGEHLGDLVALAAPDPYIPLEDGELIITLGVDVRRAVLMAAGPNEHRLDIVATIQGSASASADRVLEASFERQGRARPGRIPRRYVHVPRS